MTDSVSGGSPVTGADGAGSVPPSPSKGLGKKAMAMLKSLVPKALRPKGASSEKSVVSAPRPSPADVEWTESRLLGASLQLKGADSVRSGSTDGPPVGTDTTTVDSAAEGAPARRAADAAAGGGAAVLEGQLGGVNTPYPEEIKGRYSDVRPEAAGASPARTHEDPYANIPKELSEAGGGDPAVYHNVGDVHAEAAGASPARTHEDPYANIPKELSKAAGEDTPVYHNVGEVSPGDVEEEDPQQALSQMKWKGKAVAKLTTDGKGDDSWQFVEPKSGRRKEFAKALGEDFSAARDFADDVDTALMLLPAKRGYKHIKRVLPILKAVAEGIGLGAVSNREGFAEDLGAIKQTVDNLKFIQFDEGSKEANALGEFSKQLESLIAGLR